MSIGATIDEAVRKSQGDKDACEVFSLDFSSCQSQNADELFKKIASFPNLKTLNLSNVGLKTLMGFPALPSLEELDVSENELCDDLSALIPCLKLAKITMNGCGVKNLETLAPLAKLPNLQSLSLKLSPVENLDNFNKKCFALLPNVLCIGECNRVTNDDEHDGNGNGADYTAENGDNVEEEDDDDDEDESDEEIGIEALQKSDDLDDEDEEDYNPNEAELDECDDDFDDEEDENDVDEDDTGANLSGAGVTGPRRPTSKRRYEAEAADDVDEATASKVHATEGVEENVTNGTAAK